MPVERPLHNRHSMRLTGYDYRLANAYFITICTFRRERLFGDIVNGVVRLSPYGQIVAEEWERTGVLRPYVQLDAFVVMPNHVHGIVVIGSAQTDVAPGNPEQARDSAFSGLTAPQRGSLGGIVGQFKAVVTKRINQQRATPGRPVWQRNYYDHIIRSDRALETIRAYILNNPLRWVLDRDNPASGQTEAQSVGAYLNDAGLED